MELDQALSLGVGANRVRSSRDACPALFCSALGPLLPHALQGRCTVYVATNVTYSWDLSTEIPSGLAYLALRCREAGE